jgi:hypothetical protein
MEGKKKTMLFQNGHSEYKIMVSAQASLSERTAAQELQQYLGNITGTNLPITHDTTACSKLLVIGYNTLTAKATRTTRPLQTDEGFTMLTKDDCLYIFGGSQRGTMYGVYSFLEEQCGVLWLTKDYTVVPHRKTMVLPQINVRQKPVFNYRDLICFGTDGPWKAHNRINAANSIEPNEAYGNLVGIWGMHTLEQLVPVNPYFSTHPEYFSMRDGKRQNNGQLCLSNPDLISLCTKNLSQVMTEYPMFQIYSVTPSDNRRYCQCAQCTALENSYGGPTGLLVWFVNQVARRLKDIHPDKLLLTLAYDDTQQPPRNIRPDDNVIIRFCDNHGCFSHPLENGCDMNAGIAQALQGWGTITNRLYVLDYVSTFGTYLTPFANFQVLGPNLRTMAKNGVQGVSAMGQYQTIGGDFAEMKNWILSHLMWNPYQDTDSLARVFGQEYYKQAAQSVLAYYDHCKTMATPTQHADLSLSPYYALYTKTFIQRGEVLLDRALADAKNDTTVTNRVNLVRAPFLYMKSFQYKEEMKKDGSYQALLDIIRKFKPNIGENMTATQFLSSQNDE